MQTIQPEQVEVEIRLVEEVLEGVAETELDEMWSYVGKKANQRWLWHATSRITGKVLAYTFGQRKDEVFLAPQKVIRAVWYSEVLYGWLGGL